MKTNIHKIKQKNCKMNRLHKKSNSRKKHKACGYRKLAKTDKGRKIIRTRRKKGRKIL